MAAAGNKSVFGLVDWDSSRKPCDRLFVLGEGKRNGLENHILDPIIVALVIIRDLPQHKGEIGIPDSVNYMNIFSDMQILQRAMDKICIKTLGSQNINKVKVAYVGGLEMDVDSRYPYKDDHQLESDLTVAFPYLQSLSKKQAGVFMAHIINTVLTDHPEVIPVELQEVMQDLLQQPGH